MKSLTAEELFKQIKKNPNMPEEKGQILQKEEIVIDIKPEVKMIDNYISREIDNDIDFWAEIDKTTGYQRKPIALIGDSGSGKNYAVMQYAFKKDLPILVVPCDDSQVLRELLGYWKAVDGTTIWNEGLLSQYLQKPCVVLFDEVNCLPAGKLFMLHELLENRRLFVKDAPSEQSIVKVHEQARIFLSMNPPEAKYSGTNRLNSALANRPVFIEVPSFKDEEIMNIKTGQVKLDEQIKLFYMECNKIIKEQKLRISISKRNIDAIIRGIKDGLSIEKAVMHGFINSALATATVVERDLLKSIAITTFGASKFSNKN